MRDGWRTWVLGIIATALLACSSPHPPGLGDTTGADGSTGSVCWRPGVPGCPCSQVGTTAACGDVVIRSGTYVSCSMGNTTCDGNAWSPCIGNVIVSKSLAQPPPRASGGLHFTALGMPGSCTAGFNVCDPDCNQTTDDPTSGFTAPVGFAAGPTGLSLSGSGSVPCTSLNVTPSTSAVTVTSLTTPVPITLTATAVPAGCATSPYTTAWTVDDVDQSTISGTNNTNGLLTLQTPLPGTMNVTAYAAGVSGIAVITIKLNIVDTTGISPETASTATQYGKFYTGGVTSGAPLPGTTPSTASWLYPYANTYLPLALPAPVVMYKYNVAPGTSPNSAIKLSLRYPAGSTEAASTFNYATVVSESTPDPRVYTLQTAWSRFEQTARGSDVSLVLQRWTGGAGGVLENETSRTIHLVDGQLKGTVFYQSYRSPLGGNVGAILSIAPGATTESLAVQPSGNCTVCHELNSDGSKMIVQDGLSTGNNSDQDRSKMYNLAAGGAPSPPVLATYANVSGGNGHDATGDKFDFGGAWKDGSLYMTHGGAGTGDVEFHAPPSPSQLYDPLNPATAKVVAGWANDEEATAPKFSLDGTKLAFGFWGGTALPKLPSGTLPSDPLGTTVAVVDFGCNANCTANWAVTNARAVLSPANIAAFISLTGGATFHVTNGSKTVTATGSIFTFESGVNDKIVFSAQPGVAYTISAIGSDTSLTLSANYTGTTSTTSTATHPPLVSWPSFLPDGSAVVFQRQIVSSRGAYGGNSSDVGTVDGAQADLWISNVTATSATASTPIRLNGLNGVNAAGVSYMPGTARNVSPTTPYHSGGLTFTIHSSQHCSTSGTAHNVYDYQLNYLPSVCQTQAGGYNWVVFTTRRMYGNLAYDNPWDGLPVQSDGSASTCSSFTPPTKKLWIAALDGTYAPGTDPSHPAFYLPGQELTAGNGVATWVNKPCAAVASTCVTSDDCCGGVGGSPTTICKITTPPTTKTCRSIAGACAASGSVCNTPGSPGDCCTGLTCPAVGGTCFSPASIVYVPNTYTREFIGTCTTPGTRPVWRFFQWQSTIPANTSIAFSAQTKELVGDTYAPAVPIGIGTASTTTPGVTWGQGPQTVDAALVAAGLSSKSYLLVTMAFNPDMAGTVTPTLKAWQQNFDCVAAE